MNQLEVPIGRPCPARWDQMAGDDLTRYCRGCHQVVHDLSARSSADAIALLRANPTACVRYTYDRNTGAIVHPGCDRVGARLARRRLGIGAVVAWALATPIWAVSALFPDDLHRLSVWVGWSRPPPPPYEVVQGAMALDFEPAPPPDPPR